MSSASIAVEISQCDSNISISQEKIARLEKELLELESLYSKFSSLLITAEDDYESRKSRRENIENNSARAKLGRAYSIGMSSDLADHKSKVIKFSNFVEQIRNDVAKKKQELEDERRYLDSLYTSRSSLQSAYDTAVYNEAVWEASQNKDK